MACFISILRSSSGIPTPKSPMRLCAARCMPGRWRFVPESGSGRTQRTLPDDACLHDDDGPRNQICLNRFGMNTFVRSRVPSGEIDGMVIRHGEAFSISEALTVWDDAGGAVYRPTVHYAYRPC